MNEQKPITIRDLYPHMNDDELAVAEANLRRFVALIARIYDRLKAEGKSWPAATQADLTARRTHPTIAAKGRIPQKKQLNP